MTEKTYHHRNCLAASVLFAAGFFISVQEGNPTRGGFSLNGPASALAASQDRKKQAEARYRRDIAKAQENYARARKNGVPDAEARKKFESARQAARERLKNAIAD